MVKPHLKVSCSVTSSRSCNVEHPVVHLPGFTTSPNGQCVTRIVPDNCGPMAGSALSAAAPKQGYYRQPRFSPFARVADMRCTTVSYCVPTSTTCLIWARDRGYWIDDRSGAEREGPGLPEVPSQADDPTQGRGSPGRRGRSRATGPEAPAPGSNRLLSEGWRRRWRSAATGRRWSPRR
jgi:hypothetical protein